MNTISITSGPIIISLSLKNTTLSLQQPNVSHQEIPYRNIIDASFDTKTRLVKVTYLYKTKKKNPFLLSVTEGRVAVALVREASEWAEALMNASYAGVPRSRCLLIFLNPHGGMGQSVSIFEQKVRPIFAAARCSMEVIQTTRQKHAYEIVKSIPLKYDAIITVSGDGLIHEVLNGFAHHSDPVRAFATPVAPIPTGTGNGLSLNLLGIEEGFDVCAAALNVIKGLPMKVDLFSFTQNDNRTISFMAQTLGLMADLDLGTEHLRWMGDARFTYGFIKEVIRYNACPIQLSYRLAENDKQKMAKAVHAKNGEQVPIRGSSSDAPPEELPASHDPPLQSHNDDLESWTCFDGPIYYIYAGKGPYVGRDLMAFPVSLPNDGLIDIAIMANSSRADIIGAMNGAKDGTNYWHPKVQYMKAHAYRVKPLKRNGNLSVDGESFPFEEYQVDVHKGLGTFLSLYGHYVSSFQFDPTRISQTK